MDRRDRIALLRLPSRRRNSRELVTSVKLFVSFRLEQGTSTNLLDVEEGADLDPAQLTRGEFFG